jgi:hypothetical protein
LKIYTLVLTYCDLYRVFGFLRLLSSCSRGFPKHLLFVFLHNATGLQTCKNRFSARLVRYARKERSCLAGGAGRVHTDQAGHCIHPWSDTYSQSTFYSVFPSYILIKIFNHQTNFRSMFLIFIRTKLDYTFYLNFKVLFIYLFYPIFILARITKQMMHLV